MNNVATHEHAQKNVNLEKDAPKAELKHTEAEQTSAKKKRDLLKKEREICELATD